MALYREHKRAEFFRYWGEGHAVEESDNVHDMWERIYSWLDEFLVISRDQEGDFLWGGDKVMQR